MSAKKYIIPAIVLLALVAGTGVAYAEHAWGNYHWARMENPFTLKLGNNVTGQWSSVLATASTDWTASAVLDTTVVSGLSTKNCRPTNGRVEVCNSKYGNNGWLGIAQIWANGDHITQGVVKLNDTYFNTPRYNTVAWRNLVTCQEVGHTFGLDHQDEDFSNANLGTCMDYTNDPASNQHPNAHDYEELVNIYAHNDAFTTILSTVTTKLRNATAASVADEHTEFGTVTRRDAQGKPSVYEKDLGKGEKLVTHVFWAE
jgi:hypothetical protein